MRVLRGLMCARGSIGAPSRSAPDEASASQKNERVALDDRKSIIPNFTVLGQPVTSAVRSNPQNQYWTLSNRPNLLDICKKWTKTFQNILSLYLSEICQSLYKVSNLRWLMNTLIKAGHICSVIEDAEVGSGIHFP